MCISRNVVEFVFVELYRCDTYSFGYLFDLRLKFLCADAPGTDADSVEDTRFTADELYTQDAKKF